MQPIFRCATVRLIAFALCLFFLPSRCIGQPKPPSAEEQRRHFQLPVGFEIQLVLSDPQIGQPMNLNFDAAGRLWITHSVEYPYPAAGEGVQQERGKFAGGGTHPPRDRLSVVEIGAAGQASRVTHFAERLNIPIGQTPLKDGSEALVYGIPSIFHVVDRDGDGQADEQTSLYSRFGNIDVHGNANSFTRWIDGWIYGCHGFSNHSEVTDAAGRTVVMDSGNTYRFRSDGSHFQQFTWGQVNPFGITFDPLGNLFDSDCHSKPVYQLLRGATYPHFGNPEPAVGFGPTMIDHSHGSTGVCGPAYYAADHFPAEYRDNLFICNPVTGRVHRDKLKRVGSTLQCDTQPDFITTQDPWFRPVDAIVGPDGALYLADFCNLVIGHYEAPLDDPQRDRTHGRVWRVVWKGESETAPVPPDLTQLTTAALIARLADPNLQIRTLATNYLVDCRADEVVEPLRATIESSDAFTRAHGLWVLERLGQVDPALLETLSEDRDPLVRVHRFKLLAERANLTDPQRRSTIAGLADPNAFVRRAAADALGQHPTQGDIAALLSAWERTPAEDTHLIHVLRLTLQRQLQTSSRAADFAANAFSFRQLSAEQKQRLLQIASISEGDFAAEIVFDLADPRNVDAELLVRAANQITRTASPEVQLRLVALAPQWFAKDLRRQFELLSAIFQGMTQRPEDNSDLRTALTRWLKELAPARLHRLQASGSGWSRQPVLGLPSSSSPWGIRHRSSSDGESEAMFWDSIAKGEQLTGVLRSPAFSIPKSFSFWMCGHNGFPGAEAKPANQVRLVLLDTQEVLARELPPRSDIAQRYTWNFADDVVGRQGVLEIVDADAGDAYAWIGVGRFDPPLIEVKETQDDARFVELLAQLDLRQHAVAVQSLILDRRQTVRVREQALRTGQQIGKSESLLTIASDLLADASQPESLRILAASTLGGFGTDDSRETLVQATAKTSATLQREIAVALARTPVGIDCLLETITAGNASARLLQDVQIVAAIHRNGLPSHRQRIAELTTSLTPVSEKIEQQLAHHRRLVNQSEYPRSAAQGQKVFIKNCAACHRIGKQGNLVGPQLDGIGNRGEDRLLEDILDPNRNVDVAFRSTTIVTIDGNAIDGLVRSREGQTIVMIDSAGRENHIRASEVEIEQHSGVSVMPGNFGESLTETDLQNLLEFLKQQRSQAAP